jgi:hypothetical protein
MDRFVDEAVRTLIGIYTAVVLAREDTGTYRNSLDLVSTQ